jgi:hypothetical protein
METEMKVFLLTMAIGVIAYFGKYLFEIYWQRRRLKNILIGEITAIKKSCEEAKDKTDFGLLRNSTPLWQSIAENIGFLRKKEIVAAREAVRLYMQTAKMCNPTKSKFNQSDLCERCISACDVALIALTKC